MAKQRKSFISFAIKLAITLAVLLISIAIWLDAYMMKGFLAQQNAKPSIVYARPLELYPGLEINQQAVIKELEAAGYHASASQQAGTYRQLGQTLSIQLNAFHFWDGEQAADNVDITFRQNTIDSIYSRNDKKFGIRLEPISLGKIYTGYLEDREFVTLEQAPKHLMGALLATEDRHFFQHYGISIKGISRAFLANIRGGRISEGGSTITQQLVKNLYLNNQRSYLRKLAEVFMAIILELRLSKFEILEAYINQVYVAQDGTRAIHGFGLASQHLFNKSIEQLSLTDSALLIAMMKGPSYYHPINHPERTLARRNTVLDLMVQENLINQAQASEAKKQGLNISSRQHFSASYPAYLDLVRQQLLRDYSQEQLNSEGLRIFTHMDPQWQWHSQERISQGISKLRANDVEGAAVVVDYATGDVLALIGGKQPRLAGFNRALNAKRPISSLVKPAVYLTALERGYTLASVIPDQAISIPTSTGTWQPQNYERRFHGDVLLMHALAKSYNAATVALGMELGLDSIHNTLHRLGVENIHNKQPSLLLGSLDLSPIEVAQMYSTIAANGFYSPLKSIREITEKEGKRLKRYSLNIERRILAEPQYLLDYALQNVMQEGTGRSQRQRFSANTRIAGKTGTSSQQRDSWFAGYNNKYLSVVWLGNDDNQALSLTGASGALTIWADIMQLQAGPAHQRRTPETIRNSWVHSANGLLSNRRCQYSILIPFVHGSEPKSKTACTIAGKKKR